MDGLRSLGEWWGAGLGGGLGGTLRMVSQDASRRGIGTCMTSSSIGKCSATLSLDSYALKPWLLGWNAFGLSRCWA
jgi:hypothetical protein